ncbi:MAG: hypothetical protein JST12_00775 [Armatimonadetes bacterium]|nr:hypothetical protein [Armatimonadota bacterium]MBS1700168.1 hypothetical protein [Armatimonadota bacterium]MBS1726953.1 hypothetical protein [Armatimonadota bacterium]
MLVSADDQIGAVRMNSDEVNWIYQRLALHALDDPRPQTVAEFSEGHGFMPMLVARTLNERRPEDTGLTSLIATNEFLIKNFGKNRLSHEFVEGMIRKMDLYWRGNDPLGVYQPGDMFYVDDDHPLRDFFPVLILAPVGMLALMLGFFLLLKLLFLK